MTVTLLAHAKLTVSLAVTGVRADGYHLLDAEMVSLDLADTLEIADGDDLVVVEAATGLPVPAGDDNLVRRALALVGRTASVRLTKRIPAGGGLGGGSADAAAVLWWAGCRDAEVAVRLGGDVPFCLTGGRARVRGIGEDVTPLPLPGPPGPPGRPGPPGQPAQSGRAYTLLTPPFGVSTVAVYRAWDAMGGPHGDGPNDLEVAALQVEPRLVEWRNRLADATGRPPVLAGSGSTWWVEGAFAGEGRIVARAVPAGVTHAGGVTV